jgi:hypothetical protein
MANNHKVPEKEAQKWIGAFDKLKKGLKIDINNFFLEEQTWKELSGTEKENRIRVYFGLEGTPSGKLSACAYAVSTILDGSGIYRDQVQKVFKLEPRNMNSSANLEEVKKHIQAWREWRKAESATEGAVQMKPSPIFPVAFLLHSDDLKELFAKQGKNKIKLEFGKDSGINFLMSGETLTRSTSGENEYFDYAEPCPPYCDPESPLVN